MNATAKDHALWPIKPLHAGWAIGTLGASLTLNALAVVGFFFMNRVLLIDAALVGLLLSSKSIVDTLANPTVGFLSDRLKTRWGRRRPLMLAGALFTGLGFAGLFAAPVALEGVGLAAYVLAALVSIGLGYSLFNVPYMALPAELEPDYRQRSKMVSYRVLLISIGTMGGAAGAQWLAEAFGDGRAGYARMGLVVGAAITFFMALCVFALRDAPMTERPLRKPGEKAPVGSFFNQPFVALLGTKFLQLLGLALATASQLYFFKFVLEVESPGKLLLGFTAVFALTQFVVTPLWLRLAVLIEKRACYMLSSVLFALQTLSWLLATPDEPLVWILLRSVLGGIATAGLLLMGQSMLPDVIDYDSRRTGERREASFSGFYSFVEKVAFIIGPAVFGFVLAAYGFDKVATAQSPEALDGLSVAFAVLPAVAFVASLVTLAFYDLTEKRLQGARNEVTGASHGP